jgi:hypothetical protein
MSPREDAGPPVAACPQYKLPTGAGHCVSRGFQLRTLPLRSTWPRHSWSQLAEAICDTSASVLRMAYLV